MNPVSMCIDHGYTKCLNKNGYRRAWDRETKKLELLHRVVYCQHNDVPLVSIAGFSIRHTCDNPRCINPYHLLKGTHHDNMRDRSERGRCASQQGELNPKARLTVEDVHFIKSVYVPNTRGLRQELATRFDVSPATISDIVSNRSWNNA